MKAATERPGETLRLSILIAAAVIFALVDPWIFWRGANPTVAGVAAVWSIGALPAILAAITGMRITRSTEGFAFMCCVVISLALITPWIVGAWYSH